MGCSNSKIDSDDAVATCKARKRFMRQAVDSRHAFAASHAQYIVALKAMGSVLRKFAEGEVKDPAAAEMAPSDAPSTALVALPLPKPLPPPPMSPSLLSASLPSSPQPPPPPPLSPPRLELLGPRNTTSLFKSPEFIRAGDNEEPSSHPPLPLITTTGYVDDSNNSNKVPPSRQAQYVPPPLTSHSRWRNLFMGPFHPGPHPDQNSEESQPAQTYDNNLPQVEEEDEVRDAEDVDPYGPAAKDSDYDKKEANTKAITEVEPELRSPKETIQKNLFKGAVKVSRDLAIIIPDHGGRDLLDVLKEVDDLFSQAADTGEAVSNILETTKVHYHSSFSESLREVGELARMSFWKLAAKSGSPSHHKVPSNASIMSEETSSIGSSMQSPGSFRSTAWVEGCGMTGSHASTLDRLYAWEKKLYLEVKGAEVLRTELEKNYALYRNQDTKVEDQMVIDRTRDNIKMLQTRILVAIQAVDAAAIEIQKLRDDELYPQLLDLLEGMMVMWKDMSVTHQAQMKAVEALKRLGNSAASEPVTSFHQHSTVQLEAALNKWSMMLQKVVSTQRDYMRNLTGWLRLSLKQFPENMDTSGSCSPSHSNVSLLDNVAASPIYVLCQQWQASIDELPDRVALEAITGFAAEVHEMLRLQCEELKIKKRVDRFARELEKRETSLFSASMKEPPSLPLPPHPPRSPALSSSDSDENNLSTIVREGVTERRDVLQRRLRMEASKRKLEDEQEAERKAHIDTRTYTLNSLQTGFPSMFQALVTFSDMEADIYDKLYVLRTNSKLASITDE